MVVMGVAARYCTDQVVVLCILIANCFINSCMLARPWSESKSKVCRLLVDAASTPAFCAAVLFIDNKVCHTIAVLALYLFMT